MFSVSPGIQELLRSLQGSQSWALGRPLVSCWWGRPALARPCSVSALRPEDVPTNSVNAR